ncbi:MAG TPA: class I SAM-dependent methyltransferase [Gammaproteobacteria bacterium]|nr:class I SAM-dependent methyltransferase [Gammaproteobacteria bacterium]
MKCYLCNCDNFNARKGTVRDNDSLKVLECVDCGLVMLDSFEHIQVEHYENAGMHGKDLPSIDSWLRDCEQDDQRRFEMLKPTIGNSKILDFGSGASGFINKAQSLAAEVAGVEPEKRVQEYWNDSLTLYPCLEDAGAGYDLITAFHVIEHLPDPRSILREMATHLSNDGRMVIEVPSSEDALLTLFDCKSFQHFTYWSQHLYLFNPETLRELAVQAGLSIVSIQQFQRYPLSNHLHWLSRNKPGGHQHWSFLDSPALTNAYAASLAATGKCDTLIAYLE